jgi:hypothetical protein
VKSKEQTTARGPGTIAALPEFLDRVDNARAAAVKSMALPPPAGIKKNSPGGVDGAAD